MSNSLSLSQEYLHLLRIYGLVNTFDLANVECIDIGIMRLLFERNNLPTTGSVSPEDIASSLGHLGCLPLIVDPAGVFMSVRSAAMRVTCGFLMDILAADLHNNIDITSGVGFDSIFIGEFPTGLFNACAIPAKKGAIVLVDSGLIRVMFSVLTILFLARTGILPVSQAVVELSDIFGRYVMDPMYAYKPGIWFPSQQSNADHIRNLANQVHPIERMYALSALAWYAIKFSVCHEYGHMLLGHLRPDRMTVVQSPVGKIEIADRSWPDPWNMELNADAVGVDLLLKSDNPANTSIRMARAAAPLLLLQVQGIIGNIERALYGGQEPPHTHPPSEIRVSKIVTSISGCLNKEESGKVSGLLWDLSMMERLLYPTLVRSKAR